MHGFTVGAALAVAMVCAIVPGQAAQAPRADHIWTNADMTDLRARGLLSIVGTEPAPTPAQPPTAFAAERSAPSPGSDQASRTEDPAWYSEQAAQLQTELAAQEARLNAAQTNLADARNLRGVTGSFNLAAGGSLGVTPEDVIANLAARVADTQSRLDELSDLARRNDIPPGVLRAAAS
jgi:hypothetical protein